jgi:kynurenine formamidase
VQDLREQKTGWLDLSQPLFEGMPQGAVADRLRITHRAITIAATRLPPGYGIQLTELSMPVHCGTHFDAPNHFVHGRKPISDYGVERFISEALVLNIPCLPRQALSVRDLEECGARPHSGDMLFIRTGWGSRFNSDHEAAYYGDHPHLLPEVADWLLEQRVHVLGTDTINPDAPPALRSSNYGWPIHCKLLSDDVLILENLNLEVFASEDSYRLLVVAAPLAIRGSDGGPVRVLARLLEQT